MVRNGRANQKLVWGPWNHFTNKESRDGVTDFTPDGYIDMRSLTLRWFDRWLKHMPNGIDREPAVDQFMLGENQWYHANVWPPANMRTERWYLQQGGALAPGKPKASPPSKYVYDPAKYIYTNDAPAGFSFMKGNDAASLCRRGGQLVFESTALKKPLRLDGPIRAKVFASTDVKDTDWAMTLLDVHPDGVAVPIQTGFVRARYRNSLASPTLLKPGEVHGYDLDLWQTGIAILAGHRLRVVVESTLFPDMDRNLNTGEPAATAVRMLVAHQKIYHDPARASYVELPVLGGTGVT
jgi:putative CocE/NonD family hydrolase